MDLTRLDADAVRSIQRLGARGFEAYLVGGCVRDLLLDRDPKDFDIATAARPQQVKRAFPRNCRIIGRRFKLAHLHFDGNRKILEVATFRSSPVNEVADDDEVTEADGEVTEDRDPGGDGLDDFPGEEQDGNAPDGSEPGRSENAEGGDPTAATAADSTTGDQAPTADEDADLLILRDNEFGTVEEDAVRRDFTINALFLDPVTNVIIDYVGGMQDVEDRLIRTIGDPETRFREDPIRILRAAKFAGRLEFHFDGPTLAAMRATSGDLVRAAPPRILEEILRLLRGGHALPSFQILRDVGGLKILLPHVDAYLEAADADERRIFWRTIDALDNHVHNGGTPTSAVTLGCLFLRPILHRFDAAGARSLTTAVEEIIGPLAQELRLPRRDAGALKRICSVHPRFTATGKRRFRLESFLRDQHMREALELFELTCYATEQDFDHLEHWRGLLRNHVATDSAPPAAATDRAPESRRRERGGRTQDRERPAGKKPRQKRDTGRKASSKKASQRPAKKAESQTPPPKKGAKRGPRKPSKAEEILTIEPETYDLSAFDRELAPREVPRFDTIVESQPGKKKRRVPVNDDSYKPPPPPGGDDDDAPPPPASDDVFGDW